MIKTNRLRTLYVIGDYLMSNLAWLLFNIFRFGVIDAAKLPRTFGEFYDLPDVRLGQLLFPILMICVFYLSGYYRTVILKSRLEEFLQTTLSTFIGTVIIFFIAIVNDTPGDRITDYKLIGCLWTSMFIMVYLFRISVTTVVVRKILNREWSFNTLVVGNSPDAAVLVNKLRSRLRSTGMKIVGFVSDSSNKPTVLNDIPVYDFKDLKSLVNRLSVTRLIVIPEKYETTSMMLSTIYSLLNIGVPIYIPVSIYHILISRPKYSNIVSEPLINITEANVSDSTMCIKRVIDIVFSSVALILLLPLFVVIAIVIKFDSKGPVLYCQERVGYHKRPFTIFKFRSMTTDAESNGPALSGCSDPRVTRVGHFLRKYRIDELPQFWNVVKGDMSLIGPRPERAYYIEKIMEKAPYYSLLQQIRPGITSLGMVKYGYASTIDSMIERMNYDLIYLENISVSIDIKILCYTILTVIRGRGV